MNRSRNMEKRELLRRRKKYLESVQLLTADIRELRKKLENVQFDMIKSTQVVKKRLEFAPAEPIEKMAYSKRILDLSRKYSGFVFSHLEEGFIDGSEWISVEGVTGSVTVTIKFKVKQHLEAYEAHLLKVEFEDYSHASEMESFKTECLRKDSIQLLLKGIKEFSVLSSLRRNVLEDLEATHSHFFFSDSDENVGYVIEIMNNEMSIEISWKIFWSNEQFCMKNDFNYAISDFGKVNLQCELLLNQLCTSQALSQDEIKDLLKSVCMIVLDNEEDSE